LNYTVHVVFKILQPSRKKKFINKNEAVTFHLVHRSQKDPLLVKDEAPQHVLLPETEKVDLSKDFLPV